MAPYRFRSLESDSHIRVLYLKVEASEQLSGRLVHHDLDENPTYDCLSYVWGCDTKTHSVLLDGSPLPVTLNLYSALKRMRQRSSDGEIAIWADGICINQDDITERNQQVTLMRRIFSKCQTGLLYLGEAADESDLIPEFIVTLRDSMEVLLAKEKNPIIFDPDNEYEFPDEDDPGWKSLKAFLYRPWFRRVWIVQEYSLPPTIRMICGQWEIGGTCLAMVIQVPLWLYCNNIDLVLRDEVTTAAIQSHVFHLKARYAAGRDLGITIDGSKDVNFFNTRDYGTLIWLLDQSTSFLATEPLDKIFALIPLFSEFEESALVVDYSKTKEDVEAEIAQYLVRNGYGLSLLLSAQPANSSMSSPSWFPDWTSSEVSTGKIIWHMRFDQVPDCQILSNSDTKTITVTGSFVQVVQSSGIRVGDEPWFADSKWIEYIDALAAMIGAYPTGEEIGEAVWRTLIANKSINLKAPAPPEYGKLFRRAQNLKWTSEHDRFEFFDMMYGVPNLDHLSVLVLEGFKFSTTANQLFCMIPGKAKAGDSIFVVKGDPANATFVVRKDPVLNQYRWIGHAYVHGIWDFLKLEDLETESIIVA